MMRRLSVFLLTLGIALPASAINVRHMNKKLDKATDSARNAIRQPAEKAVCKTQKKPICYATTVKTEGGWSLVKIVRPEGKDKVVVLRLSGKKWRHKLSLDPEKLSAPKLTASPCKMPVHIAKTLVKDFK